MRRFAAAALTALFCLLAYSYAYATEVTLEWDPSARATGYRLVCEDPGLVESAVATGWIPGTEATVDLSAGMEWTCDVIARNNAGESGPSEPLTMWCGSTECTEVTEAPLPPGKPRIKQIDVSVLLDDGTRISATATVE